MANDTGAVLQYANDKVWGYVTLNIDKKTISGKSTKIDRNGKVAALKPPRTGTACRGGLPTLHFTTGGWASSALAASVSLPAFASTRVICHRSVSVNAPNAGMPVRRIPFVIFQ